MSRVHETHRLVLRGDLNQYGYLFGGLLLAWVDEASWIAASLDYPKCNLVTIGLDKVVFRHRVEEGVILEISSKRVHEGRTSVTYEVVANRGRSSGEAIFTTRVTFVNIDEQGNKRPLISN